jgi:hypothetical protein
MAVLVVGRDMLAVRWGKDKLNLLLPFIPHRHEAGITPQRVCQGDKKYADK